MGVISRGIKNAFRNTIRTVSITFILALAIAMSLIMLLALKTVQAKIDSVKSSIGNIITVSPAGVRGFEGGGELLTETDINSINSLAHITKITKTINDRLRTDTDTNLKSAIEPGSFGERQQRRSNTSGNSNSNSNIPQSDFTMPIMVTATSDLATTASLNVSSFKIASGEQFDANSAENVAMIGSELATKNNLKVGSTFKAYNKDIKVVGIFDGGNRFANGGLVMPLKTLQSLSDQTGQLNSVIVQTDSIDSLQSVQKEIQTKLGTKADVASQQDTSNQAVAPLENIKTISLYSLFGSLAAGAIIIFLTMLMIVRERRREIGVLKAIGSSNVKIVTQFTIESLALTLMGSVLGVVFGVIFSNPVLKVLVNNSQSTQGSGGPGEGMGRAMRFAGNFIPGAQNALRDIQAVVGYDIILYGILAAIIIAIIGSAIPSFIIAKVRPAEVMRAE